MSYRGYCNDEADIIHIANRLNTVEEVINLIDTSVRTAETLIHTIFQLERALN